MKIFLEAKVFNMSFAHERERGREGRGERKICYAHADSFLFFEEEKHL